MVFNVLTNATIMWLTANGFQVSTPNDHIITNV